MKGKEMNKMIKMTPETMRQRAGEYSTQASNLDSIIKKMDKLLTQLQTEWEGQAADGFAAKFAELKPGFTKARDLITDISTALKTSAEKLEQTDKEIGSSWRK
ncbi:WXG100 family type VII secretion target [Coprococcus eutactus]|jgi:WXG100 family type VII secretion target|uniref:WXG100 family type VII secretion target n=1 Tax=Coprococcus eutactus TaxID=33043 RepID=UPI002ED1B0B6